MISVEEVIQRRMALEPEISYLWYASLPAIEKHPSQVGEKAFNVPDKMDDLNIRVSDLTSPQFSFDTFTNTHGSTFTYTAAHRKVSTLRVKIDEMTDGLTLSYLTHWQSLMGGIESTRYRGKTGFHAPPSVYKRDITLIRLDGGNNETHSTTFKGAMPTSITPISYSYESEDPTAYEVTFTIDDIENDILTIRSAFNGLTISDVSKMNLRDLASTAFDVVNTSNVLPVELSRDWLARTATYRAMIMDSARKLGIVI